MKRIRRILAAFIAFFCLVFLASCGGSSSGVTAKDVDMDITTTKDKATVKLTLSENDNIKNKKAVLYIICNKVTDTNDESKDEYHSKQSVSFSNSVYTSSTVTFSSLITNQEYNFVLYVTFDGVDTKVTSKKAKTSETVSTTIASKDDFENNLLNDLKGEYTITSDIDLNNESINLFSSEPKAFQGKLDGGIYDSEGKLTGCHTIKNVKLSSASYIGLFGYTKGATIKNLIIEDVTFDVTSRSTASIGALIGYAINSYVENVTIKNFTCNLSASSLAEHNTGGVVGLAERSTFNSVYAENVNINYSSARVKVNVGLFAGAINGEALVNGIVCQSCGAKGSIKLVADYSASGEAKEYIYCGGFVGSVGFNGKIDDCYSVVDLTYSRKDTMARTFDLCLGGFVGTNTNNMNITNSLAIASVAAYAGILPTEGDTHDYSNNYLCSGAAYMGGFIGKANNVFRGISNSYAKLAKDIVLEGSAMKESDQVVFAGDVYGSADDSKYITDSALITTEVPSTLSEELQSLLK